MQAIKYDVYKYYINQAKKAKSKEEWHYCFAVPPVEDCTQEKQCFIGNIIYYVASNDISAIINEVGGSAKLSKLLDISYRTLQDWKGKKRKPTETMIRLIGYALINTETKDKNYYFLSSDGTRIYAENLGEANYLAYSELPNMKSDIAIYDSKTDTEITVIHWNLQNS